MLEFIGFLVWIAVTIILTAVPFIMSGIAKLGGGLDRLDVVICLGFGFLAAFSWYKMFSSITLTIL